MNLEITHTESNGIHLLQVSGEIDAYTAPQFREQLLPLTEIPGAKIKVDLSGVQYLDSTGLGIFVAGFKSAKQNDGLIEISGMTSRVQRLFDITGLADVFQIDHEVKGGTS
ncbi:MAG TPA: STAS domain-containing protein [Bacillales bacterium]|nr:STAS domain-containing protein [Bacillales bacterium]